MQLENIIDAKFVEDHMPILENMESAVFALEKWLTEVKFQVLKRLVGKINI
jgi:hypothetical protein